MLELLGEYADAGFIEQLGALAPAVGVGFLVGIIAAILGWVVGLVIGMAKVDL